MPEPTPAPETAQPDPAVLVAEHRKRSLYLPIVVAVALAFLIRLWFLLEMHGQPFSSFSPQFVDSFYYHSWALRILHGDFWGSDVFYLRPLYPYLLAGVYAVFGVRVFPVQLLQAFMAAVSCFLLYEVTRRMFNRRAGVLAAFGFALTGILVFYTGTLLYVELTVFLSLLFVWLLLTNPDGNSPQGHEVTKMGPDGSTVHALGGSSPASGRWWRWLVAGVVFGLLVISRPELLVLLPFVLVWLWRKQVAYRSGPAPAVRTSYIVHRRSLWLMPLAAMLIIAIVPVRNYIVARDPVLFTAHSGVNFYYGNNPSADGTWQPTRELEKGGAFSHENQQQASRTIDGRVLKWSEASAYWTRKALRFIFGHPAAYLKLLGRKALLFVAGYEVPNDYYPEIGQASSLAVRLAFVNFGLALALGLVGMFLAWPLRRQALPAYLFVAAYLLSSLVFYVLSRLRAPVLPFLLMFAGYGLSELIDALKKRRAALVAVGLLSAGVYLGSNVIPVQRKTYSAQAWTMQGNILRDQERFTPAADAFRRALRALPNYHYARYCLVLVLAGSGQTADAEAEYRRLERSVAGSRERKTLEFLAGARVAIANSLGLDDPARPRARQLAGAMMAFARRDYARAAALYQATLAEDPNDTETHFMLGLLYVSMDSIGAARTELRRVLALDPQHGPAASALRAVESRLSR